MRKPIRSIKRELAGPRVGQKLQVYCAYCGRVCYAPQNRARSKTTNNFFCSPEHFVAWKDSIHAFDMNHVRLARVWNNPRNETPTASPEPYKKKKVEYDYGLHTKTSSEDSKSVPDEE